MPASPRALLETVPLMFRALFALCLSLALCLLLPIVIPDGTGQTYLPWKKVWPDPVKAWHLQYFLDPYRELYQSGKRLLRTPEQHTEVKTYRDAQGNWHLTTDPTAPGESLVISSGNADLNRATRDQALLALGITWLLLFPLAWTLLDLLSPTHNGPLDHWRAYRDAKREERELAEREINDRLENQRRQAEIEAGFHFISDNPYTRLGVRDTTPSDVIREVYRTRMRQFSADQLRTLGEAERLEAQQEAQQLSEAWEQIKRQRRIRD